MGYIPLPEMTNIGDTRVDERRTLLCNFHYFEAKKNCFYVVPFNRDDDPVDSFLTRVNQKHRRLRSGNKLKFKPPKYQEREDPLDPPLVDIAPKPRRPKFVPTKNGNSKKNTLKIHFCEDEKQSVCGLPLSSTKVTADVDALTCKHCISLVSNRKARETANL